MRMGLSQSNSDIEESQEEASLRHESEENIYRELRLQELQEYRKTEEICKRSELRRKRRQQQSERQQELKAQQEFKKQQELERKQELKRQKKIVRQKNVDPLSGFSLANPHITGVPTHQGLFVEKIIVERQNEVELQANLDDSGDLNDNLSNLSIREEPFVEEIKQDTQLKSLLLCVGQSGWIDKVDGDSVFVLEALKSDSYESSQPGKENQQTIMLESHTCSENVPSIPVSAVQSEGEAVPKKTSYCANHEDVSWYKINQHQGDL